MKKYIYMAVAAIAALSSCGSDNDSIMGEADKQPLVFTGTMEGAAARATIENNRAKWEEGDQISINGNTYNAQSAGLTTTFKAAAEGQEATGDTYNAYFPASLYNSGTLELPANVSETWPEGKFNMPMYATSTTTDLEFKNLCGVLKITVTNEQINAVKSIKVSANKAVSGAFTVYNHAADLEYADLATSTLTVTYTEAVETTEEGVVFYVAVPAQTYQKLKIELDANGDGFTKSMTTTSIGHINVERSKIYAINFEDNAITGTAKRIGDPSEDSDKIDVNWVQLWEHGPKFAVYNVGVTDGKEESYGGYYTWGGTVDQDGEYYYHGDDELNDDTDTATALWGDNWRMPMKEEFDQLIENCEVEEVTLNGVKGCRFTGRDRYESNSVFFPAAGFNQDGSVVHSDEYPYYWSSTHDGPSTAYHLQYLFDPEVESDLRFNAKSVRAVLKEE